MRVKVAVLAVLQKMAPTTSKSKDMREFFPCRATLLCVNAAEDGCILRVLKVLRVLGVLFNAE